MQRPFALSFYISVLGLASLSGAAAAQQGVISCTQEVVDRYYQYANKYGSPIERGAAEARAAELIEKYDYTLTEDCSDGGRVLDWLARSIWIASNISADPPEECIAYYTSAARERAIKSIDSGMQGVAHLRSTLSLPHRQVLLSDVMNELSPLIEDWARSQALPLFKKLPPARRREIYDRVQLNSSMERSLARAWKHPLQPAEEAIESARSAFVARVSVDVLHALISLGVNHVLNDSSMKRYHNFSVGKVGLHPPVVEFSPYTAGQMSGVQELKRKGEWIYDQE